jgi:type II secretory pathway component HofQ
VPAGAGGIAFGFTSSRYNVNLALEALRLLSKTRTLARPEVVTVENGTASISLGEEIPYATVSSAGTQIQFKEAVLRLDVVPTVIREGDITKIKMKVTIENNSRSNTTVNLGTTAGAPPEASSPATASALASATAAMASAGGAGGCSSGMWLGRTSKGMPSRPSSSRRRGEAEARMRAGVLR